MARRKRKRMVRRPRRYRRNPPAATWLLVGGGALALYLLWRQRMAPAQRIAPGPGLNLAGLFSGLLSTVTSPIRALLGKGVGATADAQGRYVFSEANGVQVMTTTPPPWMKGQVSGWSCQTLDGKPVPLSDRRCAAQIEAFTVLEGTGAYRGGVDLGSLGGGW